MAECSRGLRREGPVQEHEERRACATNAVGACQRSARQILLSHRRMVRRVDKPLFRLFRRGNKCVFDRRVHFSISEMALLDRGDAEK